MRSSERQAMATELRTLTEMFIKVARRDTERRLAASEAGISGLQYGILRILSGQNYTLSELSRMLSREPATLVPAVDALEDKGLVKRGQDPQDRRRTPLTITRNGTAVLERVPLVEENDLLVNALEELGDWKVQRLLSLLRELVDLSEDKNRVAEVRSKASAYAGSQASARARHLIPPK